MSLSHSVAGKPVLSVIIPARNEEACLAACLESLVSQTGVSFEILLVDDGSTDRTRQIAQSFSNVTVIDPPPLVPDWSGKNNAMIAGANAAAGKWLLFTDADTVHKPASLARSLAEAQQYDAALLSYSPEQEVHGILQRSVMPVIFAELATVYKPKQVCDPRSPIAAANGQYLLISRDAYDAVGGYASVATNLLEDVALARAVKSSGRKIRFRLGADAVRTRMYRTFADLREGWTKNLFLLFPSPVRLAFLRMSEFILIVGSGAYAILAFAEHRWIIAAIMALISANVYSVFHARIRKAHFSGIANILSLLGLPLFAYLLLRSTLSYKKGIVTWKGRSYGPSRPSPKSEDTEPASFTPALPPENKPGLQPQR